MAASRGLCERELRPTALSLMWHNDCKNSAMMHIGCILLVALSLIVVSEKTAAEQSNDTLQTPITAGWIENAWIGDPAIRVKAKLDTGADTSSINAPTFRSFKMDGQDYVSFRFTNRGKQFVDVEQPVVRMATIRRAGAGKDRRPVIRLTVCVAGITSNVEFTLANRSSQSYQLLLGRSFLGGDILVDSGRKGLGTGLCNKHSGN